MPSQLSPCVHNCNTHPPSPCLPPHTHTHTHIHTHTHSHTHTRTHTHTHSLPSQPRRLCIDISCRPLRHRACVSRAVHFAPAAAPPLRQSVQRWLCFGHALLRRHRSTRACVCAEPGRRLRCRLHSSVDIRPLLCKRPRSHGGTRASVCVCVNMCEYVCVKVCVCQSVCVKSFCSCSQSACDAHPPTRTLTHTHTHTLSLSPSCPLGGSFNPTGWEARPTLSAASLWTTAVTSTLPFHSPQSLTQKRQASFLQVCERMHDLAVLFIPRVLSRHLTRALPACACALLVLF